MSDTQAARRSDADERRGIFVLLLLLALGLLYLSWAASCSPAHFDLRPSAGGGFPPVAMIRIPPSFSSSVLVQGGCETAPCTLTFQAVTDGAPVLPLTYQWSGCASGTAPTATCTAPHMEVVDARLVVTDASGARSESSATATSRTIPVFYATDRRPDSRGPRPAFTGDRFLDTPERLTYGVGNVSIPPGHLPGGMERPSVLRLEFAEDPAEHVVTVDASERTESAFYADMAARIALDTRREAFVFVHGFRVDFETALRRTGQLAWDLGFRGAPLLFSWPSGGALADYVADYDKALWAAPDLARLLRAVHERTGVKTVFLIAHSMGAWVAVNALKALAEDRSAPPPRLAEVILAAPDVDAELFKDYVPKARAVSDRLTLYAASQDIALATSRELRSDMVRAGESGARITVIDEVETVDASRVVHLSADVLAHSYFAEPGVLWDIDAVLRERRPPAARRWLERRSKGALPYWAFFASRPPVRLIVQIALVLTVLVLIWRLVRWQRR